MNVHLKLFATFRQYLPPGTPGSACDVQVSAGTRVGDILAQFGLPNEELVLVLVNGVYADLGHVLEEGDVVTAFPAMGGGDDSLHKS